VGDHRPHIFLKLAVSADGKVGLAGRKPVGITGEAARARVHLIRAMNDAILIGIGTALADDPQLTCRLPGMAARSPVRVVLDPGLRLPVTGALVRSATETPVWVIAGEGAPTQAEAALAGRGVEVFRLPATFSGEASAGDERGSLALQPQAGTLQTSPVLGEARETAAPRTYRGFSLPAALHLLAERGITRLMVEGGPTVAAAFLMSDLIDEVALLRGPVAIGPDGIDALVGMPLGALAASPKLRSLGVETVGEDTIETFERA
jgi:diaminohydroxyphosphoribosylaminopyrimidine deaminase/5-amino-6-(5-phosphoribosylamino)uracil reductase